MSAVPDPVMHVTTVDYHTGGEPFRIVTGGVPELVGEDVGARRLWARDTIDEVRQLLINEPRGHADMYGCFVTPPDDDEGDLGVVFFHNEGYSTACGHGTIALATWAVETGRIEVPEGAEMVDMLIDAPSGRLDVTVLLDDVGGVEQVVFRNVPSFVKAEVAIDTGLGTTAAATVAFGGAFYAVADAADFELSVTADDLPAIIEVCRAIKDDLNAEHEWVHPVDDRLRDIYGVILVEPADPAEAEAVLGEEGVAPLVQRNVTVFADGEVDRSATGSGTSARLAVLHHQGRIAVGQGLVNRSIVDSELHGVVTGETTVAGRPAVDTLVAGRAFRTGSHTFTLDPRDDMGTGFQLR